MISPTTLDAAQRVKNRATRRPPPPAESDAPQPLQDSPVGSDAEASAAADATPSERERVSVDSSDAEAPDSGNLHAAA
jgi:hypothetical protein